MMHAIILLFVLICLSNAMADSFRNLGFDDANTNNMEPADPAFGEGIGTTKDLLPGWELFSGPWAVESFGFNYSIPGLGYATLYDRNYPNPWPVAGPYALALYPGRSGPDIITYKPFTLIQTGDVPGEAKSIEFTLLGGPVEVYMNNFLIPIVFSPTPGGYLYEEQRIIAVAGDISAFSGQKVELKIVTVGGGPTVLRGLDSIFFSPKLIPEPCGLLPFGILVLSIARFYRQRHRRGEPVPKAPG